MKRPIALFLALASGFVLSAPAQTSAPAGSSRVAVIAFQAAVSQTNEFRRDFADLQKKFDPQRQQLKALSEEIDGLTKQLQAEGDKQTGAERASRTKALEDKKKQAQRLGEDAQSDYQKELQQTFTGVATKVGRVMSAYAQQNGYALVLDGTEHQQQAPLVLFANPATDITQAVVDAYNVKSGIPAPPTAPAAPKPASK